MTASCLMVQGTASGVGKGLLTASFCRIFSRQGSRVAPFKAQNMALNAAVTADGCEIGRAQAAQAEAAGVEPTVDMNPILLKPEGEDCSQVVVRGRPIGRLTFREYGAQRDALLAVVAESLARLRAAHDLVIIEGAGSPAGINLSAGEIVNMRIARLADAPVVLVGDIDRGGVFAAFVGTLARLEPDDGARVAGFVVNKFRGNLALLAPGLEMLYGRTGVPVLGVVPYLERGLVPAEDSLDLDDAAPASGGARLDIVVVRPPRIANFDDVEPIAREPGVRVRFATSPSHLVGADLLIVPGSKSTIADLAWLRETRLADPLIAAARAGTPLIGLCGGYQMLGRALEDPDGVEASVRTAAGVGLLPVVTTFAATKRTVRVHARVIAEVGPLAAVRGQTIEGYEIHMGTTRVEGAGAPFSILDRGGAPCGDPDGALAFDGVVIGTYLHGLFANDGLRRALLDWLATRTGVAADPRWGQRESATARYDRLADAVAAAVDPMSAEMVFRSTAAATASASERLGRRHPARAGARRRGGRPAERPSSGRRDGCAAPCRPAPLRTRLTPRPACRRRPARPRRRRRRGSRWLPDQRAGGDARARRAPHRRHRPRAAVRGAWPRPSRADHCRRSRGGGHESRPRSSRDGSGQPADLRARRLRRRIGRDRVGRRKPH